MLSLTGYAQVFNPWGPPPNHKDMGPNAFRKILNMFSLEVSAGYGNMLYGQKLEDAVLYSDRTGLYLTGALDTINASGFSGITNWINNPGINDSLSTYNPVYYPFPDQELDSIVPTFISSDSVPLKLRGRASSIPISVRLHFNFLERFRAGVGATFVRNSQANLSLKGFDERLVNQYTTDYKSFWSSKYYITAGGRYWDFWDYSYYFDFTFGIYNLSDKVFDENVIEKSNYWNFGFPIEKNLSKYFKLVFNPSLTIQSIETTQPTGQVIKTNLNSLQFQVGVRVRFPLYKNCPISNCEAQKEHIHVDKKFRGQPIHKKQNPKIGELYPTLGKHKRGMFHFLKRK